MLSLAPQNHRLENAIAWAQQRPDVDALILTGSFARDDGSADIHSDLDLEIIGPTPATLADNDGWLRDIGPLLTVLRLGEGQAWPTRLSIYADGVKIDFTLAGPARLQAMRELGLDPLYQRGYRVLLDKTGVAQGLPAPHGRPAAPALPCEEHFRERVEEFWFEAFHIPKYLARGELFVVKFRDWTMKELLLEMLEWHALSRPGTAADCWHISTRLQHWAEPEHWQALHQAFGRFDAADAERAFHATLRLYSQVAREVAARAGFDYPEAVEAGIRDLIPAPA
ncbi:aminoglycoside 6-adenylyltransferase [Chromobacterium haemolyticum]|uniref:Aminoglycoside 6-adenylyltransferase n=1 Tax=Chromobacterium haemolyticum TaxID=394935 RepID=A0ABS3GU99_9NEIS|nr:aminoglycoside 6-adenylyltransferase [Chromobacterium haemolyticum]MBK0417223.1 aminoglycoside 6-adenylyltransferase [Chromobacterium haemolyticum]MBO0418348.1 aminoglycoside 6-adenylyltransferase [Chromobacterium haemolyticum]MBO0501673.1 aminoglycoside 6-adenylyltransferase [Chromobacterium haemolyticum]